MKNKIYRKLKYKKIYKKIFFILLLFISNVSQAQQEKLIIAVAEFEGRNISAMDAVTVSDLLRTEIVKTDKFKVVDRSNMEQILIEQAFQMTGCTTQECAVQMGKLLNVNKIIVGSVMKLGKIYLINANMIDVETGEIIRSEKVEAGSLEELPRATEYLAGIMAGETKIKKKPKKLSKLKKKKKRTMKEYNKFGIGINYPGVSFKYFLNEKTCLEPKAQFGEDISVYGIRSSYYFNKKSAILFYVGLEYNYFLYKFEVSEGTGWVGVVFGGVECFVLKNISIQFDMGPLYIKLDDKNYDVTLNDFEVGLNVGVNYYF